MRANHLIRYLLVVLFLVTGLPTLAGAAQDAPLTLTLFSSVGEATPGQRLSITATLTAAAETPLPVTLSLTLNGPGVLDAASSSVGACAITSAATAQCAIAVSAYGATVTLQGHIASSPSSDTLRVSAEARADDGTSVDATPLSVRIVGPTATTTVAATITATTGARATATSEPVAPTASPPRSPTGTPAATLTATPLAAQPDGCEPNDTLDDACVLQRDAVNGPYTIAPASDRDSYSLDLGAAPSLPTTIWIRVSEGLDLITTIRRADTDALLATIERGAISTTLPLNVVGWVRLVVEQRSPQAAADAAYRIEVRQQVTLPAVPTAPPTDSTVLPDVLENNWNPQTAVPVAVGYAYDLTFACPVVGGCSGGDHDYLRVPVKAGVPYLLTTFDLGVGVDTVLDLFWGSEDVPIASNDDAHGGYSGLSLLHWTAPSDGEIVVRIAPRQGGLTPVVPNADTAGIYRFAVAMAESPFGQDLLQRVQEQAGLVTPTTVATSPPVLRSDPPAPRPPAAPAGPPAAPAAPPAARPTAPVSTTSAIVPNVPKGVALVEVTTTLRLQPEAASPSITTLLPGTLVTLQGESRDLWVRVTTAEDVLPGWVRAIDLQRVSAAPPNPPTPPLSGTLTTTPMGGGGSSTGATPTISAQTNGQITLLDPLPLPPVTPVARVSSSVRVRVVEADSLVPTPVPGARTPTPGGGPRPIAGLRVQLVTALGDLLAEGITPVDGQLTLVRDSDPNTALVVTLPQVGISIPLPTPDGQPAQATRSVDLTIALPHGGDA